MPELDSGRFNPAALRRCGFGFTCFCFWRKTMVRLYGSAIVREDGEWVVMFFDANGRRVPSCDYFTDDVDDAKATAKAEIARSHKEAKQ
jgi:hypothetical protein